MLTKEQIQENKIKFISYVRELDYPGVDIEALVAFLEESDFFTAPASTIYHGAYEGGLCQHSLNTLSNLYTLSDIYTPNQYSKTTLFTAALFHDISKTNFYESYAQNKKVYSPNGSKYDEMGNYDWKTIKAYKVKDASERMVAGTHGFNSYLILSKFLPLNDELAAALVNHHGGLDDNCANRDLTAIYNKYPLATLLHLADMLSTYIDERV